MTNQPTSRDDILAAAHELSSAIEATIGNSGSQVAQDSSPEVEAEARARAVRLAQAAFSCRDPVALNLCHRILYNLLRARIGLYRPDGDRLIMPFAVEQILLTEFLNSETQRIDIPDMPVDPDKIVDWWDRVLEPYIECPHPLFGFLERDASPGQFRAFLLHDLGVHVPFDDVLASLVIGTQGGIRAEILTNLSDELGVAGNEQTHMMMATDMANALGIHIGLGSTIWEALACANSLIAYGIYRSLFPEAVGYLGCLEALTPARFRMLGLGGERTGIAHERLRYYFEHVEVDDDHSSGWLRNVIVPLVKSDERNALRIRRGVGHRLKVSEQFWDAILERIIDI